MNLGICNNCINKAVLRWKGLHDKVHPMCKYWKGALDTEMIECSEWEMKEEED